MKRNMYNIFANIIRILIIGIFIFKVTVKDYSHLEMIPLTLIMTFYDKILENILKIKLGNVLKFFLLFSINHWKCTLILHRKCHWQESLNGRFPSHPETQ